MRVIAIANQKGGCGKTTTTVNLAAAFGKKGHRVLVVDLDPQGHSTLGLGCDPDSFTKTIYNALVDIQLPIADVIVPSKTENVDVAPSNVLLSGAELDLAAVPGREFMLSEQFKTIDSRYDVCVIDCPPSLGILTLNALIASTDVVVPVQVHYYAMEGLKQLFETCEIIQEHFYPCKVKITGLLLTFVEDRLLFTRQIQQQMREFFGDLVFVTVIHRNIRLAEAPSAGESIITYAPESRGALEYLQLVDEILLGKQNLASASPDSADAQVSPADNSDSSQQPAVSSSNPQQDCLIPAPVRQTIDDQDSQQMSGETDLTEILSSNVVAEDSGGSQQLAPADDAGSTEEVDNA